LQGAKPAFNFGGGAAKPAASFGGAAPGFQFGGATNMEGSGDTMDASSQSPKGFSFGGQPKPAAPATNGPGFSFGGSSNTGNY